MRLNNEIMCYLSVIIAAYFVLIVANAYWWHFESNVLVINQQDITIRLLLIQLLISIISLTQVLQCGIKIKSWEFWAFFISVTNFSSAVITIIVIQFN
ncbi:hypothetical protein M2408_000704 [Sphingobacterium sp. BIGb0165]|nr:hypothetical protein [Sphingobacterium sp. BIGb0165]